MVDTSFIYFAINHLDAVGGIQVTASHNPAQYNGFKINGLRRQADWHRDGGSMTSSGSRRRKACCRQWGRPGFQEEGLCPQDLWDAYIAATCCNF